MKQKFHYSIITIIVISLLPLLICRCAINDDAKRSVLSAASVDRGSNGQLTLSWAGDNVEKIDVYWSTSPDEFDSKGILLISGASGSAVTFDDPSQTARPYFRLKAPLDANMIVAERRLPIKEAPNFRDIGGYRSVDGRTVKWGIFFRSGDLFDVTEEYKNYIKNSGIKTIIDYRTDTEVARRPDPAIDGIEYIRLTEVSTAHTGNTIVKKWGKPFGPPGEYLVQLNKDLVNLDPNTYSQLLDRLLDPNNHPLLQHCSVGKDRTGFGTAITLLALGVPKDTVMQDYMLSNIYLAASNQSSIEALRPKLTDEMLASLIAMMEVRTEYLQAAFNEMELKYGSIDSYLEKGLGLTPEKRSQLRNLMLE
ncbi:MAG: tyrosine-protein phosphatase [Chloroflexi bacterium]|nr:tyrosine-protein phosphatase [Chloroflexota bacterium]